MDSANVACRRLGFPGATHVIRNVAPGSGQIWLNRVQCVGDETGLEQCSHDGFGNIAWYCNHYDDMGVECLRKFHKLLHIANILNQACTSLWPVYTWFLKIILSTNVSMRVSPPPRLSITSGVMWYDIEIIDPIWLIKYVLFYGFYMAAVVCSAV